MSQTTRTRIKICGITTPEAAQAAVDAGADALGLMFAESSPRAISLERAEALVADLPAFVEPVGVFSNQPVDFVRDVVGRLHLRTVQLHGRETPEQAAALAPRRVVKALSFDAQEMEAALAAWGACANLCGLLLDAPPPADAHAEGTGARTGGYGRTFDWHALATLQQRGALAGLPPTILAGGLDAGNVARAIATIGPYGVDVSSGVESATGVKDAQRIAAFCAAVRAADRQRDEAGNDARVNRG